MHFEEEEESVKDMALGSYSKLEATITFLTAMIVSYQRRKSSVLSFEGSSAALQYSKLHLRDKRFGGSAIYKFMHCDALQNYSLHRRAKHEPHVFKRKF